MSEGTKTLKRNPCRILEGNDSECDCRFCLIYSNNDLAVKVRREMMDRKEELAKDD